MHNKRHKRQNRSFAGSDDDWERRLDVGIDRCESEFVCDKFLTEK